ncbi:hypothetical protein JCM10295v2_001472 [Rhodotorula toruloides]
MTHDDMLAYRFLPQGGPSTLSPAELAQRTAALSKLVNPPSPTPAQAAQTFDQPTQGILRRRETTGVVGGWAPSVSAGREKKKVGVESPRASGARVAEQGKRRNDKGKGKVVELGGKELVPPTPDERVEEKKAKENNSELAKGAIKRCIPYPYCHNPSIPAAVNMNPARQHPSRILHSFVDPAFDPLASTLAATNAATANGATQSQYKLTSQLPLDSPVTMSYLQPARRGAWLIPVSASLPIPHTSPVRWFAQPPPSPISPSPTSAKRRIDWTDTRLRALWEFLTSLHESGSFGRIRAVAWFPPSPSASSASAWPEMIRLNCDAHLALAIRGLLSQANIKALRAVADAGVGGRKGEEGDCEKWLKGRALVWVDEEGRAVLTA